jgi:hypothetical protein
MATQKREKIGLDILSMRIESGRKENDEGGKKGRRDGGTKMDLFAQSGGSE